MAATAVAEFHAARGKHVLLVLDSLTRYAMAAREMGLAAGEPPASKGYTPSVFTKLAKLVERVGNFEHGSITAFYTVLMEGDDQQDPVVDAVRSFLDGHVVLSRALGGGGAISASGCAGFAEPVDAGGDDGGASGAGGACTPIDVCACKE